MIYESLLNQKREMPPEGYLIITSRTVMYNEYRPTLFLIQTQTHKHKDTYIIQSIDQWRVDN